jgi:hypothetical protein
LIGQYVFENGMQKFGDRKNPLLIEDFRLEMLKSAGLDPKVAGLELRKALDKATALLEATKTQFFSEKGVVVDSRETADNSSQLRAAEILIDTMTDLYASKKDAGNADTSITVVVNGWFDDGATEINVTPSVNHAP